MRAKRKSESEFLDWLATPEIARFNARCRAAAHRACEADPVCAASNAVFGTFSVPEWPCSIGSFEHGNRIWKATIPAEGSDHPFVWQVA